MGWEQRNIDFCKAQTDAQMAYIEAEREADRLQAENESLRELVRDVVLLAGANGCAVTKMQLHAHGGDWRTVWERMAELGVVE